MNDGAIFITTVKPEPEGFAMNSWSLSWEVRVIFSNPHNNPGLQGNFSSVAESSNTSTHARVSTLLFPLSLECREVDAAFALCDTWTMSHDEHHRDSFHVCLATRIPQGGILLSVKISSCELKGTTSTEDEQ